MLSSCFCTLMECHQQNTRPGSFFPLLLWRYRCWPQTHSSAYQQADRELKQNSLNLPNELLIYEKKTLNLYNLNFDLLTVLTQWHLRQHTCAPLKPHWSTQSTHWNPRQWTQITTILGSKAKFLRKECCVRVVWGASEGETRRGRPKEGDEVKWRRHFHSIHPLEVGTILTTFHDFTFYYRTTLISEKIVYNVYTQWTFFPTMFIQICMFEEYSCVWP